MTNPRTWTMIRTVRAGAGLNKLRIILAVSGLVLGAGRLEAQYQVYQWASFEDGQLPAEALQFGMQAPVNLQVVNLDEIAGMPPEFRADQAARETGGHGLLLKADPKSSATKDFLLGLTVGRLLDRDQLGSTGKALYQADFFLPAEGKDVPELAVLATEPLDPDLGVRQVPRSFYRFGVRNNGLYYSRILPGEDTDYRQDSNLLKTIPRPGWHRMAIVFEGADTLRFYVDGREPSFSPVKDSALRNLKVGVMLAEDRRHYDAYVDNLSIQIGGDVPLPDSPYSAGWRVPLKNAPVGQAASFSSPAQIQWLEPKEAWTEAQRLKKPFLLYFYAPNVPATEQFNRLLGEKVETREFMARHSCARVDVNQLQGGSIAAQYGIFRVPAVLIISPDVKEAGRAVFTSEDTWESFYQRLASPPGS